MIVGEKYARLRHWTTRVLRTPVFALGAALRAHAASGSGTHVRTAVPSPRTLSKSSRPPRRRTRARMLASPRLARCGSRAVSKPVPLSRAASASPPSFPETESPSGRRFGRLPPLRRVPSMPAPAPRAEMPPGAQVGASSAGVRMDVRSPCHHPRRARGAPRRPAGSESMFRRRASAAGSGSRTPSSSCRR